MRFNLPRAPGPRRAASVPAPCRRRPIESLEPRVLFAAGDLDPSFGTGGMVYTSLDREHDRAQRVTVAPDGSTFVAGSNGRNLLLAKYTPAGRLDASFGAGGSVVSALVSRDSPAGVALAPDGRVYLAGTGVASGSVQPFLVFRYRPDGSPDPSWGGGDGVVTGSFDDEFSQGVSAVALQPDGRLVIAGVDMEQGAGGNLVGVFAFARLNEADGSLDPSFGTGGIANVDFHQPQVPYSASLTDIALQPDGRIVAVGRVAPAGASGGSAGVVRLTTAGVPDASFGGGDARYYGGPVPAAVAVAADGKFVLLSPSGAAPNPGPSVFRLKADGTALDPSFGGGGLVRPFGITTPVDLLPLADGNVLIAGRIRARPTDPPTPVHDDFGLLGLRADGLTDGSFGTDGFARAHFGGDAGASAVAFHPDGKRVVAVGVRTGEDAGHDFAVARFVGPVPSASVTGAAFYDTDGDGARDADEPARAGLPLYVDVNRNGARDVGEPRTRTDAGGAYAFDGFGAGTHHVRAEPPAGWTSTAPPGGLRSVALADRQDLAGVDFGVRKTPVTHRPSADAYVRDGTYAGSRFGTAADLVVKRSTTTGDSRETYLRVSAGQAQVFRAKLRLFGRLSNTNAASVTTSVYAAADTAWDESSLTWNNKPAPKTGGYLGSVTVSGTTGKWYEVDVTSQFNAAHRDGRASFTLLLKNLAASDPRVIFASDESASNRPGVVVEEMPVSLPAVPPQAVVASAAEVHVPEGGSAAFTVKLATEPAADVVVNVRPGNADADLTTATTALTFTPANWNVPQTVTVAAAHDDDLLDGHRPFVLTSAGLSNQQVTAREVDDDDAAPPPADAVTLRSPADTYVRDGSTYAGTNFGSAALLQVKKGDIGWNREAFLRFDLSAVSSVSNAKLRLFGRLDNTSAASAGFTIYNTANTTWAEGGLTWNNRPASGTTVRGTGTVTGTVGKWYELDLTSFLAAEKGAGRNLVTLVLRASAASPSTVLFESDEGASRPELVVTA